LITVSTGIDNFSRGSWGGACGVWRGFEVKVRDNGKPAKGALVTAIFKSEETDWSVTVKKTIPVNQPVSNDVDWVIVGTTVPCSACNNKKKIYIDITVKVDYKDFHWKKDYPGVLVIDCPGGEGYKKDIIKVKSDNLEYKNGYIYSHFYLAEDNVANSFSVHISLYGSNDGREYLELKYTTVTLYKNYKKLIRFALSGGYKYYGIAVTKPGTSKVQSDWVCSNEWTIKL